MKRRVLIVLAIHLAAAGVSGRAALADPLADGRKAAAEEYCAKGRVFLRKGSLREAEKALKKAIESEKSYHTAHQLLGALYARQNRLDDAIRAFQAASAAAPNRGDYLYNVGLLQAKRGRVVEAIESYEKAIAVGLNDPAVYHNLALLYSKIDRPTKALPLYKKAIEIDPDDAMLHYDLAADYQKLNRDDDALREYQKALSLKPNSPPLLYGLAVCYVALFKYEEAQKELRKLAKVAPEFQGIHLLLGETFFFQNRFQEAKNEFLKATKHSPKQHIVRFRLGQIYEMQGKKALARREYKRAIALAPNENGYHYRLATILNRMGRTEDARRELAIYERLHRQDTLRTKEMLTDDLPLGGEYGGEKMISPTVRAKPNTETLPQPSDADESHPRIRFTDVTEISGVRFKHYNDRPPGEPATILETTGSGVAFCDYDGDGDLDIYFVNGSRLAREKGGKDRDNPQDQPSNSLYENLGDGSFRDVTASSRAGDTGYGMGCVFGDYDNDGDDDLYVTNYGANQLYRNDGDGRFTVVTDLAGVGDSRFSTGCVFADFDNDGFLDLYAANYIVYTHDGLKYCNVGGIKTGCAPWRYEPQSDILYRNNGDGTFTDVTKESGVYKPPETTGRGLGLATGDYDLDGDADLYVANDATANFLLRNNGDGSFTDVGLVTGAAVSEAGLADSGMGVDFQDYDNDGRLDLLITNFQDLASTLYHNDGAKYSVSDANAAVTFTDVSFVSGIGTATISLLGFGVKFLDCNNDGYLDIFIANGHVLDNINRINSVARFKQPDQIFVNRRDGSFVEASDYALRTTDGGAPSPGAGRGAASGDYDNDGDTDIIVSNSNDAPCLLRNDCGDRNSFLMIKLIGRKSNRNAVGARVTLTAGGVSRSREVQSGGSYLSHSDWRLLFGLKDADSVGAMEIRWPSGETQTFSSLKPNRLLVIMEGKTAPIASLPLKGVRP